MSTSAQRGALAFIFITVTLDMVAFGIIAPVYPKLVMNFVAGDTARAATIFGAFGTVWALMHFLAAPVLGVLSDRFGRRPVIIASNLGLGLDYAIMALAPNLGWLLAGRVLSGILSASLTTANAYITDVTVPEKRAAGFGMLGAAFGLGFILGPAVGGLLANLDPRLPFWVAAAFSVANALYGTFVLPESLAPEKRRSRFEWRRANPLGSLTLLRSHHELLGLAAVFFLLYTAHEALPTTWVFYVIHRYAWNSGAVGLTLALVGICSAAVSALLVGPVTARFGARRTLLTGIFFVTVGFSVFGLAAAGGVFLAGIVLIALGGFATPAAQSLMTQRVSESEQGELQGALSSMRGICMMIGPGIFTLIFAAGIDPRHYVPGAPWFLGALFTAAALFLAARVTRGSDSHIALTPLREAEAEGT